MRFKLKRAYVHLFSWISRYRLYIIEKRISVISGWHIIYAKSNSEAICKKIYLFSAKIRKDGGLQS